MNNFQLQKALTAFSHLRGGEKRGCEVFVGDHEYAELCKFLVPNKIVHNYPSQWHSKFPQGYIELLKPVVFAQGGYRLDLKNGTVCGVRVHVFPKASGLSKVYRRVTPRRELFEYAEVYRGPDLLAFANLIRETATRRAVKRSWTPPDEFLRREIAESVYDLGLKELEDLVAAAEPPAWSISLGTA